MLEKIGLPAKPSLRGGNWVVDASHCQGCSSQFTFINRKHHCRRCGGLFCNSCTQQRMILRGQGDSPVRICDPCKKLEDAARFELRYGHKSRTPKGNSKQVANNEEEVLNQILGTDGKQPLLSGREAHTNVVSDLQRTASTTSCSNLQEESATPGREEDTLRSMSIDNHALDDIGSSSPEELRQQAVEEKKKYRILKGERKPEEALQAFKRGKELERQAGALEIALRKSRIKASKASNLSSITSTLKTDNDCEASSSKRKLSSLTGKPEKDDLASELRELGWSDVDLHDADKKPAKLTLEGELSDLLGEIPQKSAGKGTGGIDKTQVIALKKKALMFKREGKLAEAKEELKRAKLLEKQLEEQELLGGAEDSDDELSALIHSMDDEKQDDLLLDYAHGPGINFVHLSGPADDLAVDGNFEVTDEDLNDPELAATLKSFGWTEENDEHLVDNVMQPVPLDQEALSSEILTLKREALNQKRVGNVAEAMGLLKKAKLLEKDIESMESDPQTFAPEFVQKSSTHQASGESSVARIAGEESVTETIKLPRKSKVVIQRELLGLKKKALALRREGRVEEAEEELRKGKVLEQQLEEMENAPKTLTAKVGKKNSESAYGHDNVQGTLDLGEEGVESDITEQDMHDPALLSVLKDLGWNDDDVESASMTNKTSKPINSQSSHDNGPSVMPEKATKSKAEIQKELLGLKRKALALRRQGKTEEAEEELRKAKDLENQMAEIEVPHHANSMEVESHGFESLIPHEKPDNPITSWDVPDLKVPDIDSKKQNDMTKAPLASSSISAPETPGFESHLDRKLSHQAEQESVGCVSILPQSGKSVKVTNSTTGGDRKILQSSAEELPFKENSDIRSFSHANASTQPEIQISAKGNTSSENEISSHRASSLQTVKKREITDTTTNKLVMPELNLAHGFDSSKDEILARKRKAVALKREGKLAEAREELRQAKLLEKSLEDAEQTNTGSKSTVPSTSDNTSIMQGSRTTPSQKPISGRDRFKLQQESLSHKRCALKLRREGKIEESEAEFELAKALENQLEEIGSHGPSKVEAMDDAVVEDLLDPQLMSALKAIGWQDTDVAMHPSKKSETKSVADTSGTAVLEKAHLEEQIKTEKLRALNLKRAGRQAEALEALRTAKRLEKKLDSFSS